MVNGCLQDVVEKTPEEIDFLESMMPEVRQEGYTCVSGCQDCVSCDGNDYLPRD
ncbi:MAG: hypothetical protein WC494_03215 [Candidatus Pacearchaeota archaeon]